MKKFLRGVIAICLIISVIGVINIVASATTVDSGTCGENLTRVLDDGSLTISGTGEMYSEIGEWEWNAYLESIKRVVIKKGVTNIGDYAFSSCVNLTEVIIPDSVTSIGWGAFSGCENLVNILIPDSVTNIGGYAFDYCIKLEKVNIPEGVESLQTGLFWSCESLEEIIIPDSVAEIRSHPAMGPFLSAAAI